VSLRRGAQNALTAALELCAIAATLRTLESSPWVDADPRTARVRCARRLLLLLAAGCRWSVCPSCDAAAADHPAEVGTAAAEEGAAAAA